MGFRTTGGDLGWIQVELLGSGNGVPDAVEAIDWAYNNTPGGPIDAGQTSGPGSAVPEPGYLPLALLALGAGGLIAWRRRRNEARPGNQA